MEGDVFVQILKMNVEILLKGGDERIQIRPETGRNKYHLNPLEFAGLLNRGSCTNSTLNEFSNEHVVQFSKKIKTQWFAELRVKEILFVFVVACR